MVRAFLQQARSTEMLTKLPDLWEGFSEMFETDMGLADVLELATLALELGEFEYLLLVGEAVRPWTVPHSGEAVHPENWYHLHSEYGLIARGDELDARRPAFVGADLLAMHAGQWGQGSVLKTAKRLLRLALAAHLGDAPLKSRDLFRTRPGGHRARADV